MRTAQLRWNANMWRYLPLVVLVTGAVAVLPVVLVWRLRSAGAIGPWWLALLLTAVLSLLIASGLRLYWARIRQPFDLLFSELLLWGWVSHYRTQRQLVNAMRLLGVFEPAMAEGPLPPASRVDQALPPERHAQLLRRLADALDAQDMYLDGHSRRVARHAVMIGRHMGLSREQVAKLRAAAAIHDVGKLHVPPEILAKPAALTEEEFALVRRHPEEGAAMVAGMRDPDLIAIVRHHHERVDGRGYPAGLSGDEIPLGARIVAVADTFDAITSPRPYRPAAGHRDAIEELRRCAGTQLDPAVVRAFVSCYSGWRQVLMCVGLMFLPERTVAPSWARAAATAASPSNNVVATVAITAAIGAALTAGGPASTPAQGRTAPPQDLTPVETPAQPVVGTAGAHLSPALAAVVSRHFARATRSGSEAAAEGKPVGVPGLASKRVLRFNHATRRSDAVRRRPGQGSAALPPTVTVLGGQGSGTPAGSGTYAGTTTSANGSSGSGPSSASGAGSSGGPGHSSTNASHHHKWTPPGQSGSPPPGLETGGPPGQTGQTPGQSGSAPPGLRGETPPGHLGN